MPKIIENVKDKILLEAKDMLIKNDYSSFNIRDLSKQSGVSTGTIYNYFTNKRNLINAVFFSDWNKALDRMKDINLNFSTLEEKVFQVYLEMNDFLKIYLNIFLEISSSSRSTCPYSCLNQLSPLITEILVFEKNKGNLSTSLSNEIICKFIINNLMLLCTDKTLNFKDIFSMIKL